jgi:hypothetical protein
MKKFAPYILILLFTGSLFLLNACLEKDKVAPTLKLNGPNPYYISLNSRYIEYGYDVYDNRDAVDQIAVEIVVELDTLETDYYDAQAGPDVYMGVGATIETGEFIVQYIAKDQEGNKTVVERTVIVRNDLEKYARLYDVKKFNITQPSQVFPDYQMEITFDEAVNNRIWFPRFSNLQFYNLNVYADVRGDSIFIPFQPFPASNNYYIEGFYDLQNYFSGKLNRTDYKFYIEYRASNNTDGTQVFREEFEKF